MSVENLAKELEAVHEQIRQESDLTKKIEYMGERDKIMRQLAQARKDQAVYYQKQADDIDEGMRPKTFQSPFKV
jgi:hypothetical protein